MIFATLFLIPFLVALGFFLLSSDRITVKELFFIQVPLITIVASLSSAVIHYAKTTDTEIWSGRVVSKKREWTSCEHSYQCNCITTCNTDSKGNQSCSTICQTCYEHLNDYDWAVYTSNAEKIYIERIDRQGSDEPPRWRAVTVGEPTAIAHSYKNYVKAAPDSLFNRSVEDTRKYSYPTYPGTVHDYYHASRVVAYQTELNVNEWNTELSELNADIGRASQVNIILVITENKPQDWYFGLERAWLGGKKNDVVVVINKDGENNVNWVRVMAWTNNQMVKTVIRDDLLKVGKLKLDSTIYIIGSAITAHYRRKPMAEFKYLEATIKPTTGQWVFSILLGLGISIIAALVCMNNDFFNEERWNTWDRHRRW
jgi:hypothetical protein